MQDWRAYVTAVVTHCKGRVAAYEIWNEPNNKGFWTGTTQAMVSLTREASTIIHRIDPQALVVSPAATDKASGVSWLSQFLADGGAQYVDVIGFHFYVAPQPPEAMLPVIQDVRNSMKQAGIGDKPIWNTETGWQAPKPFPSDQLAAAWVARAFILSWAAGVSAFYWYAWDNHGWVTLLTTQPDNRTLAGGGLAYQAVQRWLVGAEMKSCDRAPSGVWTCATSRSGSPAWIVWNESETASFTIPPSWHARSWMSLLGERQPLPGSRIEVGQMPVLVSE
jgi:Glycosyl hydrolase catalytic core